MRDTALVAGFELSEALRSRKALALLLLYLAGAIGAALIFVEALRSVENVVADQLQVAATRQAGAMTSTLMESEEFLSMIAELVGDRGLARELVSIPPMALFYGWMAMTFVPILVTLTSADTISSEVATGSARFALFRTDRLSWTVGKLAGQAALLAVGILAGGAGVMAVGLFKLSNFQAVPTLLWLLRLSGRAWIYGLPYLGLATGISQLTRSVHWARGGSLLALFGLGSVGGLLSVPEIQSYSPVLIDTLLQLFPRAYQLDLWRPELAERAPSLVMLPALGGLFFAVGNGVFSRRDA